MGLDINGVRFLLYANRLGVNFEQTAMIGRQNLDLTKKELESSLKIFGHPVNNTLISTLFDSSGGYAEALLTQLGAKNVHSFDASPYEGASHVHDMNMELPFDLQEKYSVVLDGGSLEHVFNFPVAIKNCMEMLRIGGAYLGITPANNFMGHGFYQFSPEIYFSVFSKENGFKLVNVIAFEDRPKALWYSIRNPNEVKSRVLLVNDWPVYLLVIAIRQTKTAIFNSIPQQSDYLSVWNQNTLLLDQNSATPKQGIKGISIRRWVKRTFPFAARHLLQNLLQGYGFNSRFFSPMDPAVPSQISIDNDRA